MRAYNIHTTTCGCQMATQNEAALVLINCVKLEWKQL